MSVLCELNRFTARKYLYIDLVWREEPIVTSKKREHLAIRRKHRRHGGVGKIRELHIGTVLLGRTDFSQTRSTPATIAASTSAPVVNCQRFTSSRFACCGRAGLPRAWR